MVRVHVFGGDQTDMSDDMYSLVSSSVAVLADIPVRSPRKFINCIIRKKYFFSKKYPEIISFHFENKITGEQLIVRLQIQI